MNRPVTPCPRRAAVLGFAAAATLGCAGPSGSAAHATLSPDEATFRVEHRIHVPVPEGSTSVRIWFPLPREEEHQTVRDLEIEAPAGFSETTDRLGNRYVHVEASAAAGSAVDVVTRFVVTRREYNGVLDAARTRPLSDAERSEYARYLGSDRHIVVDDRIRQLAQEIAGDEPNPLHAARRLYDWTLDNVEYWVKDPSKWKASPVGSSEYCLSERTGNCTDFHSLWTALARARGIPTRMKYGSLFKPSLDGVDQDASYHCWPESWFPGLGWVPNDVAVADIYVGAIALDANNRDKVVLTTAAGYSGPDPRFVDYYFGNLDSRRVTWTEGRDLQLEPPQRGGPVNAVAKGYVEIDGREFTGFQRKMTYREVR